MVSFYKEHLSEETYGKLISSILKVQHEIIRSFKLSTGINFLSFEKGKLVWNICGGHECDCNIAGIRQHALESIRRHQLLSRKELREMVFEFGDYDQIIISFEGFDSYHVDKKEFERIFEPGELEEINNYNSSLI